MEKSQAVNLSPKENEMKMFRERMVKKGLELETDQFIELIAEYEVLKLKEKEYKDRTIELSKGEEIELNNEIQIKFEKLEQTRTKLEEKSNEIISGLLNSPIFTRVIFQVEKSGSKILICTKSYNTVRNLDKFLKNKNIIQALYARETGQKLKPELLLKQNQETSKENHLVENLSSLDNPNLLSVSMDSEQLSTSSYGGAKLEDKVKNATTASKEQNVNTQPFRGKNVLKKCKRD